MVSNNNYTLCFYRFLLMGIIRAGHFGFPLCQDFTSSNLRYMIFDAPEHGGIYKERLKYLETIIPQNDNISIAPYSICSSKEQLLSKLEGKNNLFFFQFKGLTPFDYRYNIFWRRRTYHSKSKFTI